jgi:hypothetical protein
LKLVKKIARSTLELTGIDKDFLSRTQRAQQLSNKIDKCDEVKLKSFCTRNGV